MSDLTTIVLMLAVFVVAAIPVAHFIGRMWKRCDDILTGVVNGVQVSLRTRWLYLFHDYLGASFGLTVILGVIAAGYFTAAATIGDPSARSLAYLCGSIAGGFFVFNLFLVPLWVIHFVSVLRRAEGA